MRSAVHRPLFPLLVLSAPLWASCFFADCGGGECVDQENGHLQVGAPEFYENVTFEPPAERRTGAMPVARTRKPNDKSEELRIDEAGVFLKIVAGDSFKLSIKVSGEDIAKLRYAFGCNYFEVDVSKLAGARRDAADPEGLRLIEVPATLGTGFGLSQSVLMAYGVQAVGVSGVVSRTEQETLRVCKAANDCDTSTPSGGGGGGGTAVGGGSGGGTGAGGNDAGLPWKDTWLFVQGDKAVQFRMALVSKVGDKHTFKMQYRVNSTVPIWLEAAQGYKVWTEPPAGQAGFKINFAADMRIEHEWELPFGASGSRPDLFVELINGSTWDATRNRPVDNQGVGISFLYSCTDDNSLSTHRCNTLESRIPGAFIQAFRP